MHTDFDTLNRTVRIIENYVVTDTETDTDQTVEYDYDAAGRMSVLRARNPKGSGNGVEDQQTLYLFESPINASWTTNVIYPDSSDTHSTGTDQVKSEYDRLGRYVRGTDQRGVEHTITFDEAGRLQSDAVTNLGPSGIVDDAVLRIERTYDDMSRMAAITSYDDPDAGSVVNQVAYSYNGYQLVTETKQEHDGAVNASTLSVQYNYDDGASGGEAHFVRLSSVEYPGGREVFYLYPASGIGDALNRVEAIADDGGLGGGHPIGPNPAEYEYLGSGTIVSIVHPAVTSGLTLDYNATGNYEGWDRFGRIVNQQWTDGAGTTTLDHYVYTYDFNSNRKTRSNALNSALSESYTYDALDRLMDTDRGGTDFQSWNLDSLGNWDSFTDQGATETREHNAANELTGVTGAIDPTFDAAGNMTSGPKPDSPTDRQHYKYDAWNRLVEVSADDGFGNPGALTAEFEYDGRNYRIQKSTGGVLQAFFYNEGNQVLETRTNGNANPAEQYVWGLRYVDAPIVFFRDANSDGVVDDTLYYTNDANMNVTALIDGVSGAVVERYHYDPHGDVQVYDGNWTPQARSAFDNVYLYAGRRLDSETGLFYYRARYFDSSLGRFIQRDPIGYFDDVNLYRYVRNQATQLVDASGLAPKDWTKLGPPKWVTKKETVYHRWILIDEYYTLINGRCYDYKEYQKEQMKVIDERLIQEYHRENQRLASLKNQRNQWRNQAAQHSANSTTYNKKAAASAIAGGVLIGAASVAGSIPVVGWLATPFIGGAAGVLAVYAGYNRYLGIVEGELAAAAADRALALDDQIDEGDWPNETKSEELAIRSRYTRWQPTNQFGYKAKQVPLIFCLFSWCQEEEPNDDATPIPY